jgi:hypothetical protein
MASRFVAPDTARIHHEIYAPGDFGQPPWSAISFLAPLDVNSGEFWPR